MFSDEPGWHGKALRGAMAALSIESQFVSLSRCAFDLTRDQPKIVIPGFRQLPDAAFVRGIAAGNLEEIVIRLDILHALEILGVPVFNDGRAIERTVDKAMTSFLLRQHAIPTPRTWVCESVQHARYIAEKELTGHSALVMKPLFGSQGQGIVKISSVDQLDAHLPVASVFYLQEYLHSRSCDFRDWRVFIIDGQAVGGMQRRSKNWVTNRAQGAVCEPIDHDADLFRLAAAAASAVDVDYAGVDLMLDASGNWTVGEVNGIPAWQGLERVTGNNITRCLVDAFVTKITSGPVYAQQDRIANR
ncbi:MAG TPA: alpha-L-glutamate ligase [Gammaproteobacteria bacterium]|nr:alpha-L-glutamate ligase [Gammaproteobacteria bacterium]